MGDTTRNGTAKHTFCVVGGIVGDRAKVPAPVFSFCAAIRVVAVNLPGVPLSGWCEVCHCGIIYTDVVVM